MLWLKLLFKNWFLKIRIATLAGNSSFLKYYYQKFWKPKLESIDAFINELSKKTNGKAPFTFIQVGSNDGFQNDPICKFIKRDNWQGVLIEPQKSVFPTLSKIYCRNSVELVNKAIAKTNQSMLLYKLGISEKRWATGLSSFVKDHLVQQIENGYVERKLKKHGEKTNLPKDEWIVSETVECTTFEEVLAGFTSLDLLIIDTEGFDYEILKLFPFNQIHPKTIIYESANLNATNKENAEQLLKDNGYRLTQYPPDTVAELDKK
ncbi:MAG: FkbM family methyltransferase [Bacteroidetes bacterium]|nr:FkbM family methyltransferase [Bacteroidota bacterium]